MQDAGGGLGGPQHFHQALDIVLGHLLMILNLLVTDHLVLGVDVHPLHGVAPAATAPPAVTTTCALRRGVLARHISFEATLNPPPVPC